jgi:DNA-binding NarL/FixJ family response regulator
MSGLPVPSGPRPVRTTLLSEHPIVIAGVQRLLEPYVERVLLIPPDELPRADLVLYDVIGLHDGTGEDLELAIKRHPGRVLALSRELQPGLTARALGMGAVASVPFGSDALELVVAIEDFAAGRLEDGSQTDLDNQADRRRQLGRDINLSPREQSVLALIVSGQSNDEIAAELYLSINTVKSVIRSVYRKIGIHSRTQATAWGVEHGFPSGAPAVGQ